ncbi:MAG: NlpC/P60 family protein [Acidobacteriota bacterium]
MESGLDQIDPGRRWGSLPLWVFWSSLALATSLQLGCTGKSHRSPPPPVVERSSSQPAKDESGLKPAETTRVAPSGALAAEILDTAYSQLGRKYRWGGQSPEDGFDCSGFVQWVFSQNGLQLPRTSRQQFKAGSPIGRDEVLPGDLLFFSARSRSQGVNHVGIYSGGGRFLHSPSSGERIQESKAFEGYYLSHFAGARRVISPAGGRAPGPAFGSTLASQSRPKEKRKPGRIYIVRKGDYIWALARRFKVSPWSLLAANGLEKGERIYPGQKLIVPE